MKEPNNTLKFPCCQNNSDETRSHTHHRLDVLFFKHKALFIKGALIICVALIGLQSNTWYKAWKVKTMQAAYQAATTDEQKLQFAERYAAYPLAALVFLSEADRAYENQNYARSLEFYQKSELGLKGNDWLPRALLGHAISALALNQIKEAIPLLEKLAQDQHLLKFFKIQAIYFLALAHYQSGHYADCQKTLSQADSFSNQFSVFLQKIQDLKNDVQSKL